MSARLYRSVHFQGLLILLVIGYMALRLWNWWGVGGCRMIYVYDGDTFAARCPTWQGPVEYRVRVHGYDTPETGGPTACPNRAAQARRDLEYIFKIAGKSVSLSHMQWQAPKTDDQQGRYIAQVTLSSGENLSDRMLEHSNHARVYYPGSNWQEWTGCASNIKVNQG